MDDPVTLRERIIELERRVSWGHFRRIPSAVWNEMLALLPRCECGRIIAPKRVARGAEQCSIRCKYRIQKRRQVADERYRERELEAIAESAWQ